MADKEHPQLKMTCKVDVAVDAKGTASGNLKLSGTAQLDVDCYDYCEVKVPVAGGPEDCVRVTVQPGAADQIALLVIASDVYAAEISYSTTKETPYAERMKLKTLHAFLPGAVLFGSSEQANYLYFWNTTKNPACIHILVGRKGMGQCVETPAGGSPPTPADEDQYPHDEDEAEEPTKKPPKPGTAPAPAGSGRRSHP